MTVTTPASEDYGIYVDGRWEEGNDVLTVDDLADGGVFARIAAADEEHAELALTAATAPTNWPKSSSARRGSR